MVKEERGKGEGRRRRGGGGGGDDASSLMSVTVLFCRCQFVPFRDYLASPVAGGNVISGARLAKDVLAELPEQFLEYKKKRGLKPGTWH